MSLAEIQVLSSLAKAEKEGLAGDRDGLEAGGDRFWIFKEDWSAAFPALVEKGLIEGDDAGYALTEAGRPAARAYHAQRPDMYWYYYQKFYPAAWASEAHTKLCERAFGLDLCQEGQSDMTEIDHLIARLDLKPGERVLDIGCGAGGISGYIARRTGAAVTGLDYAEGAVAEAAQRAKDAAEDLTFVQGDLNQLDGGLGPFDAIVSIDTLYWVEDMEKTLRDLLGLLNPGGRMAIFMNNHLADDAPIENAAVEKAALYGALTRLGLAFETEDFNATFAAFWRRNHEAATALKADFEAEGNGFIAESLIREAEDDFLPGIESRRITRYFYLVKP